MASGWYSKAIVKKVEIGLPYAEDPSIEAALCATVAVPSGAETVLVVLENRYTASMAMCSTIEGVMYNV
jgi:hypothetical protein